MIAENIEDIRARIGQACHRAGRPISDVTLVAVSKTFPSAYIREAVAGGVVDIGENYVQELVGKKEELSGMEIRWHFIGHLQSNKAKILARWIHLVHAVDSLSLAREIDRHAATAGRRVDILIEVNTTGESSKFGVDPAKAGELVHGVGALSNVRASGLMTMGPFLPDPEGSRPMFRQLRMLRDELVSSGVAGTDFQHLSMGMTGDFEVAIEEGATIVRIGTAIFGSRKKRNAQTQTTSPGTEGL